jgi:anaphase-promoting complex subunit 5
MVLKARIFTCAGQPLKGLSIALRAATAAERHMLVSVLVEAIVVLGPILMELRNYGVARDILAAAVPMVGTQQTSVAS